MNQNENEKILTKIYVCVVAGEEQIQSRISWSTNPAEIGKIDATFPAEYSVYLVNDSDSDLANVNVYTGGFDGSGDKLIELIRTQKDYGYLKKGKALLLETLDFGLLDFVLWYQLTLKLADGSDNKMSFSIEKAYALGEDIYRYSPILKQKGYHFSVGKMEK